VSNGGGGGGAGWIVLVGPDTFPGTIIGASSTYPSVVDFN
jgi:hypothetical protein